MFCNREKKKKKKSSYFIKDFLIIVINCNYFHKLVRQGLSNELKKYVNFKVLLRECVLKNITIINPRRHEEKKVTRRHEGGINRTPPPSIFKSIQPNDMKLRMCNKCPVYFQLSLVTWNLIGFHGNHSNIMTSLATAILDYQIFKYFLYSNLNPENSEKTTFSDWNLQNCKIHCKVISI